MRGQWLGMLTGTTKGLAMVDVDEDGEISRGHALYFPEDPQIPANAIPFRFSSASTTLEQTGLPIIPIDRLGNRIDRSQLAAVFPGALMPETADINIVLSGKEISIKYFTKGKHGHDVFETHGEGVLLQYDATAASEVPIWNDVKNWSDFKSKMNADAARHFIFRGQPCQNRLRTTFHRSGRYDLARFMEEDIPLLKRSISPLLKNVLNLSDPDHMGAFIGLIQHHGYPTPLLDWTYSPFIAAFFAFRAVRANVEKVRIYLFDRGGWEQSIQPQNRMTYVLPHVSAIEILGLENPRVLPQQALSMLTNIDDIEFYIISSVKRVGRSFLWAVDLNVSEQSAVMADLRLMGITAASLFPGVDGTCEALRAQMFGYQMAG